MGALLARSLDQTFHQTMAQPMLAAFPLDAERIDDRDRVFLAELAVQDTGDGETAQHIIGDDADLDVVTRPRLGGREALLEEVPPAVAGAYLVDRDDLLEVIDRDRTRATGHDPS